MKWMIASDLHGSYYYAQQLPKKGERIQKSHTFASEPLDTAQRIWYPARVAARKCAGCISRTAAAIIKTVWIFTAELLLFATQ